MSRRRSGLLIPLFACPRSSSWGIGDISDIGPMTAWLRGAGQCVLQLLPLNEMARGQQSPYSAMSAMAIDPIYLDVAAVPEFAALGGEASLTPEERERLAAVRSRRTVDYTTVRALKQAALGRAFERFLIDWKANGPRARQLRAFITAQDWWLPDYALYHAIHDHEAHRPWTEWPREWQWREARALDDARTTFARHVLFYQYLQWLADDQWRAARAEARANGVALFGDLPFMVDGDSADVWAHQDEFRLDRSVGVPPDAFSATGQDWGMPAYRWDRIAALDFKWLRQRAERSAALFDGYRVDHLVGFYRTYSRPKSGGPATFEPAEQEAQLALGEQTMAVFRGPGAEIVAEDLGIVPDFVRESLARLRAPGFKIFRWERDWDHDGQPFRDPADYPAVSVAASGTHDTEPMRIWWEGASHEERQRVADLPSARALAIDFTSPEFSPALRDGLIEILFASRSELLLLPVADVFGWSARINEPGTVTPDNWTLRLPWAVDDLDAEPDARARQQQLRTWTTQHRR